MSLQSHADLEFRAAGWTNEDGTFKDEWQELLCNQVKELLTLFNEHGHSGSSAPYAVNLFKTLAMFEPIVPLTGEDWEWTELDYGDDIKYQNKRCGHVFKDGQGRAYDSEGIIFYDWVERPLEEDEEGYPGTRRYKSHFTSIDSRIYIEFPYTPEKRYVERKVD